MKKTLLFLLMTSVLTLFAGCASTRKVAGTDVPTWALREPEAKIGFYAVGKANFGDFQVSFDAAIANAKANLMQKKQTNSNDNIHMSTAGSFGASESSYERETNHSSEMSLEKVQIKEKYMSKDGTAWVLVYMPK